MTDARSNSVPRPARSRWTSFVGRYARGRAVRGLDARRTAPKLPTFAVEQDKHTRLARISDENARGWTTLAIDRSTWEWATAQRGSQRPGGRSRVRAAVSVSTYISYPDGR